MILKGDLIEISKNITIHSEENNIEVVKYDYLNIGNEHKRDCITSTYLSNFLNNNVGNNIAVGYIEANMTNSLGRKTIHLGNAPKHNLIIGIKDESGKVTVDNDLIQLKGNQMNPLTGCLQVPIWLLPISGFFAFISFNKSAMIYGAIAIGIFVLYLMNRKRKRTNLESKIRNELQKA